MFKRFFINNRIIKERFLVTASKDVLKYFFFFIYRIKYIFLKKIAIQKDINYYINTYKVKISPSNSFIYIFDIYIR